MVVAVLGVAASVHADPPTIRRGEFVDPRDGRNYPTVEIGGLTWFAENLAWNARGSFCYDDDEANCRSHGRLYRWEQALGACPAGSHLASELEWQALERAVGLPAVELEQRSNRGTTEGARLKPEGDTGFDVQYGGWRRYDKDGSFSALGENVAYWTSTETDLAHAQHRDLDVRDDMIWRSPVRRETVARQAFPDEEPVGQLVAFGRGPNEDSTWYTIAGVVGDVRIGGLRQEIRPMIHQPVRQEATRTRRRGLRRLQWWLQRVSP